jgi:hypothetical protein
VGVTLPPKCPRISTSASLKASPASLPPTTTFSGSTSNRVIIEHFYKGFLLATHCSGYILYYFGVL